jgi:hypothetical protein
MERFATGSAGHYANYYLAVNILKIGNMYIIQKPIRLAAGAALLGYSF